VRHHLRLLVHRRRLIATCSPDPPPSSWSIYQDDGERRMSETTHCRGKLMKKIRLITLALAAAAIGYYVFHAVTYVPASEYEPAGMGWLGFEMALPIMALTLVPIVFAFTGEGIMAAFTGHNSAEFRDGPTGLGTVRSVRQTGLTVNDQPQIHIEFSVEGAD